MSLSHASNVSEAALCKLTASSTSRVNGFRLFSSHQRLYVTGILTQIRVVHLIPGRTWLCGQFSTQVPFHSTSMPSVPQSNELYWNYLLFATLFLLPTQTNSHLEIDTTVSSPPLITVVYLPATRKAFELSHYKHRYPTRSGSMVSKQALYSLLGFSNSLQPT